MSTRLNDRYSPEAARDQTIDRAATGVFSTNWESFRRDWESLKLDWQSIERQLRTMDRLHQERFINRAREAAIRLKAIISSE